MNKNIGRSIEPIDIRTIVAGITFHFGNWFESSEERIAKGLTDEQLKERLLFYVGIEGGAGGPDRLDYHYRRSGFRIWVSWETPDLYSKPTIAGKEFINMVRYIYAIPNPDDKQLALF